MSATRKKKPDTSGPREADFYPTPAWAVRAVANNILGSRPANRPIVYDAGVGDGGIISVLNELERNISIFHGCDIRESSARLCMSMGYPVQTLDFLVPGEAEVHCFDLVGAVVMNPPYGGQQNLAQRFVMRALDLAHDGVSIWAFLRLNWLLDGEKKFGRQTWLRDGPGTPNVYGLNRRPSFTGDGHTDATTYAWMQWTKGSPHKRPEFCIIDCHGAAK